MSSYRHRHRPPVTRREALCRIGNGFGMLAFASLVGESLGAAGFTTDQAGRLSGRPLDHPARAKHGIFLFMTGGLMQSPFAFKKYGQCGMDVSELFPHVGSCADDICFIRSVYTDIPNHEPSMLMMNTGHSQVGRPSMGSWLTYGLGTDNKNLPGYVVLCPDVPTTVGPPLWNSAFLPAVHQGTYIPSKVERPDEIVSKEFDPKRLVSFIHNKD